MVGIMKINLEAHLRCELYMQGTDTSSASRLYQGKWLEYANLDGKVAKASNTLHDTQVSRCPLRRPDGVEDSGASTK